VAYILCSFRAGKIEAQAKKPRFPGLEGLYMGNGWRGILLTAAVILYVRDLVIPGVIVLVAAGLWSLIDMAVRNWRELYARHNTLRLLRQGRWEQALEVAGPLGAGSKLWWQFLGIFLQSGSWDKARQWLEEHEAGEERDFLLAAVLLGQEKPADALRLCPPRPQGPWQTLKAEALFQQGEWKKLLAVLRSSTRGDKLEHDWLRGASYYYLKQYKPAAKLLHQVVERGGADYGNAAQLLDRALARVK